MLVKEIICSNCQGNLSAIHHAAVSFLPTEEFKHLKDVMNRLSSIVDAHGHLGKVALAIVVKETMDRE